MSAGGYIGVQGEHKNTEGFIGVQGGHLSTGGYIGVQGDMRVQGDT